MKLIDWQAPPLRSGVVRCAANRHAYELAMAEVDNQDSIIMYPRPLLYIRRVGKWRWDIMLRPYVFDIIVAPDRPDTLMSF